MLRVANRLITSVKDQVRGARYSIRAEAAAPGAALPKMVRDNLGPLVMMGSVVSTPAARLADSILTTVESIATGVLTPSVVGGVPFPCPVQTYFAGDGEGPSFADRIYGPVKLMLRDHGVRNMLVSQHALTAVGGQIKARYGDMVRDTRQVERTGETDGALILVCAGVVCAFVEMRPIRKVEFDDGAQVNPNFMLSPNLYCGLMVGLATAVATVKPTLEDDRAAVLESVDSAVDARLARFKQAMSSRSPAEDLAREFRAIVPYLP